jgi:hypothetical protein
MPFQLVGRRKIPVAGQLFTANMANDITNATSHSDLQSLRELNGGLRVIHGDNIAGDVAVESGVASRVEISRQCTPAFLLFFVRTLQSALYDELPPIFPLSRLIHKMKLQLEHRMFSFSPSLSSE